MVQLFTTVLVALKSSVAVPAKAAGEKGEKATVEPRTKAEAIRKRLFMTILIFKIYGDRFNLLPKVTGMDCAIEKYRKVEKLWKQTLQTKL
jgi:hypothetical protein